MFRDRRGPLNALTVAAGIVTLAGFGFSEIGAIGLPSAVHGRAFVALASVNAFNMFARMFQRARAVKEVYGYGRRALLNIAAIPLRWPLGTFVNSIAAAQAFFIFRKMERLGRSPKWDKTAHELPLTFGDSIYSAPLTPRHFQMENTQVL